MIKCEVSFITGLCRPLPCTLSRAFDEIANPIQALDDAIKCGFERILVSTDRYIGGTQLISTLQEHAQNRIKIIPGNYSMENSISYKSWRYLIIRLLHRARLRWDFFILKMVHSLP